MPLTRSWLKTANEPGDQFPLNNLPFGVFVTENDEGHCCVAIGDQVLDLAVLEEEGVIDISDEPVFDVPVNISAVLGKTHISVAQLLKLGQGSVLELDRKVGEAIDIYVNNRLVARGEVVVVDERLGVTMTEIIKSEDVA